MAIRVDTANASQRSAWTILEPVPHAGSMIWRVDISLEDGRYPALASCLSADERARADRFRRSDDRQRFLQSHAALRLILGRFLGVAPQALQFGLGPYGKPYLATPQAAGLRFNLSHSGGFALVGLSTEVEIGVDVEAVRPFGDPLAIAAAHFHPDEIAALRGLARSDRATAFFRCWTRKEAVLKASGAGLSRPLADFCVGVSPGAASVRWSGTDPAPSGWSLTDLDLGPEAAGAAALLGSGEPLLHLRLPEHWADRVGALSTVRR